MPTAFEAHFLDDKEISRGLPPHRPRTSLLTDKYPACPKDWMRSNPGCAEQKQAALKSYFVPVKENSGMWLDFNSNDNHTHHVAILISIQGINPITGLPFNGIQLEQYLEKCPKHNKPFGPDRFCADCNFKWPKQNYLCSTGTPSGYLWLDGWRTADGVIRQYIITAEKAFGVANHIAGDKRVYSIGISFFLSKEPRPQQPTRGIRYGSKIVKDPWQNPNPGAIYTKSSSGYSALSDITLKKMSSLNENSEVLMCHHALDLSSASASEIEPEGFAAAAASNADELGSKGLICSPLRSTPVSQVQVKKLEIGKGAMIRQQVYDDPYGLDFWQDHEAGTIVINYATEINIIEILKGGELNLEGNPDGAFQGIPNMV